MNPTEARTIGRKKTLKATTIVLFIFLMIAMIFETRGDFANGILFFLSAALNIYTVGLYAILFGLTFLFGGRAGKEIILGKKKFIGIAVKYSVLIMLSLSVYIAIIGKVKKSDSTSNPESLLTYFITILSNTGLYFIPLFAVWLWATNQMRVARPPVRQ